LQELIGHYVNYRKQASPSMQNLLPETDFRLFAVSVRFPQGLAREVTLTPVKPGVYEIRHFTGVLRLIVVHELPLEEHNALLHLFSARRDLVEYGATHYRLRSEETSTLLLQLFERYRLEATTMADLLQQLAEETIKDLLENLPAEKLLERLSPEKRLEGLSPEKRLEGLSPEKRLAGLSIEELLGALPPETRAALFQRVKEDALRTNPEATEPGDGDQGGPPPATS
jgi:hypothetical protein